MSDNWGGYANGQIPLSAMKRVQNAYFKPDVADALAAAIAECARHKITLRINEGYRPLGVAADAKIKSNGNGDPVSKTSTGGSNQWFQYGRMQRGETPTAAYPGGSIHGWAKAADVSPGRDNGMVAAIFKTHGFTFDIDSESWHSHFIGAPIPPAPIPAKPANVNDWKSVQTYLHSYFGYAGAIDGVAGKMTWIAAQKWLAAKWGYAGAVDGIPGQMTYAALSRAGSKLR